MLPGVAEANQSSVRLIALTADIDRRMCGKGTLTQLDQNALYAPVSTQTKSRFQSIDVFLIQPIDFRNYCPS